MSVFQVGNLSAAPGERKQGYFGGVELMDGSRAALPVILINGRDDGPTVYFGAGSHGDEINGIRAVGEALAQIDPNRLKGRILAVPVQNPLAYRNRHRLITVSQLDQQNMHRVFPGRPDGDVSDRVSHMIMEKLIAATGCDLVLDYHTGSTGSYCPPHSFIAGFGPEETLRKSYAAAIAFDAGILVNAGEGGGIYAMQSMLHMVTTIRGVPTVGCEIGTSLPAEERHIKVGVNGALNVFAHLGMIETPATKAGPQIVVDQVTNVRTRRGGMVKCLVEPAAKVSRGQCLAQIINVFGEVVDEVTSPVDGWVITLVSFGSLNEGERIARIGSRSEKTR